MVTKDTHPIPTNISENTEVRSLMMSGGSINTCEQSLTVTPNAVGAVNASVSML